MRTLVLVKFHKHMTVFRHFAPLNLCAKHSATWIAKPRKTGDLGETKAWNRRLL